MSLKLINSAIVTAPACLVERGGGFRKVDFPIRFGLIDHADHTVLVDTGYGPRVTSGARSRALRVYSALLRPKLEAIVEGAIADTILVTHPHADHVARLLDFPQAQIFASRSVVDAIAIMTDAQATKHGVFKELFPHDFATRTTALETLPRIDTGTILGEGHDLFGDGRYLVIPLPGHAIGHVGVFWRDPSGPVLYATDVAWTLRALLEDRTPAVSRAVVFDDPTQGRTTERLVRAFHAEGGRVILCHDPTGVGD